MAYYEEIKPQMVEPMSLDKTFVDAEIDTGDIVCFERSVTQVNIVYVARS